uniref:Uncharacterized protein n=1 Tax=viral metagenome TaxID=1070528 RepID=A0A6C0F0V6_9ZZZZ
MSNNQKEQKYFESVARMRTSPSLQGKIWDASDIYKEVQPNEDSSYEFLHRCYTDTVMETVAMMRFIKGCVRGGEFVKPIDPMELPDSDSDSDSDDDDYYDEDFEQRQYERKSERENSKSQKKEYKRSSFMRSVICALSEMNKARMRVAKCLLKRSNDHKLIDDFAQYSQGNHTLLSKGHTLIELYRCLRHIHSGKYTLRYLVDNERETVQFDALFCMGTNIVAEYIENANTCIRGDIDMFDPAITNHNKSENWKPMTFTYNHTEEVIATR